MRVGMSLGTAFAPGEASGAVSSVLAQADAAARAGLDSLTVGDRHSTGPVVYLQNVPLIGRILATWDQRPVGCLFLVPVWHPVLLAEQIGTLAAMAGAPFIVAGALKLIYDGLLYRLFRGVTPPEEVAGHRRADEPR